MLSPEDAPEEKQCIYIIFSSTSSKMGKFIRYMTKHKYNHVSLAFEKDLHKMYSFARYYANAPLVGGFVEESALRYFYRDHDRVFAKICKIPIPPKKYEDIFNYIGEIQKNSEQYIYNTFSAALVPLRKKIQIYKAYTCLEFIGLILKTFGIEDGLDNNYFYTIADLEHLLSKYTIYEGDIVDVIRLSGWENDCYYDKKTPLKICTSTIKHFGKLVYRILYH